MSRIGRSWELVKQSFAILRSDKELLLLPITSAIACVLVTLVILGAGGVAVYPHVSSSLAGDANWEPSQPLIFVGIFVLYVANYFVIVFFNVALVGVAYSRLNGGTWTVRDGLGLAWARKGRVFEWALVAATVGIILRMLEERLGWIARIVVRLIGIAWTLACYFVVPVLAFEDLGPIEAVQRSAKLFRDTWGEKIGGGVSFGLIFLLLSLPGFGLWLLAILVGGGTGMIVGGVFVAVYFVLLPVLSAALQGIYNAALYNYANTRRVAPGFRLESFSMAWQPK